MRIGQIRFANRALGWAVLNRMGFAGKLPVFETRDGGQSWKPFEMPDDIRIYGVAVVSEKVVYFWDQDRLYRLMPN